MSFLATALLPATHWGSPAGGSTQDPRILRLWSLNYYFAIPLGMIVIGLTVWCIVRYRARPERRRIPRQFQYHIPLEAMYTIVPIIVVAILFGAMYGVENRIDYVSPHPAFKIRVEGFQWGWRFDYPNGHQEVGSVAAEPNIDDTSGLPVLRMPAHENVQFNLQSDDVNHSFYVPEFLFKRDLIQGVHNVVDITATRAGKFIGECTQLCGTYHAYMRFWILVMPPGAFHHWYARTRPNSITCAGGGNC